MFRRLVALFAVACLLAVSVRPALASEMTITEEKELGAKYFKEVERQLDLIKDPDCLNYIRGLGRELSEKLGDDRFDYTFYLANNSQINAFAMPGGYIVFFSGMVTSMDTQGELISVMAHEMSHVYYRHLANRIKKSGPVQIASIAGVLAGLILGTLAGAPQLGQAITLGSAAGATQAQLAFSREDETQADYGGYKLMSEAGYHPSEMEKTFQRIYREQRMSSASVPTYLLTHPTSPERMETIRGMVERHKFKLKKYDNSRFLLVKTRLIALYEDMERARDQFRKRLRDDPKDAYAHYGLALVEMRRSRYKEALDSFHHLEKLWPDSTKVLRGLGECNLNMGNFEEASRLLSLVTALNPEDQIAMLGLGQCYLRLNQPEAAERILNRLLAQYPDDAQARYELGIALGRLGKTGLASYQIGMSFLAKGNRRAALHHLRQAERDLAGDPAMMEKVHAAMEKAEGPKGKGGPSGKEKPKSEPEKPAGSANWGFRIR